MNELKFCMDYLKDELESGPKRVDEIMQYLKRREILQRNVRAAKKYLKIKSVNRGGVLTWELPK